MIEFRLSEVVARRVFDLLAAILATKVDGAASADECVPAGGVPPSCSIGPDAVRRCLRELDGVPTPLSIGEDAGLALLVASCELALHLGPEWTPFARTIPSAYSSLCEIAGRHPNDLDSAYDAPLEDFLYNFALQRMPALTTGELEVWKRTWLSRPARSALSYGAHACGRKSEVFPER